MAAAEESGAGAFTGVRVVELAQWVFVPVAGALLADWGADVIRIERPEGDPYRGLMTQGIGTDGGGGVNLSIALANRGKRSVALDLRTEGGPRGPRTKLLATADVFLTNFRPGALRAARARRRDAHASGTRRSSTRAATATASAGPTPTRPGYDASAFWARGGLAHVLTPAGARPTRSASGARWATATARWRSRSAWRPRCSNARAPGKGSVVDVSLLATAMWTLSSDVLVRAPGRAAPRDVDERERRT